jgi:hypothetical protein
MAFDRFRFETGMLETSDGLSMTVGHQNFTQSVYIEVNHTQKLVRNFSLDPFANLLVGSFAPSTFETLNKRRSFRPMELLPEAEAKKIREKVAKVNFYERDLKFSDYDMGRLSVWKHVPLLDEEQKRIHKPLDGIAHLLRHEIGGRQLFLLPKNTESKEYQLSGFVRVEEESALALTSTLTAISGLSDPLIRLVASYHDNDTNLRHVSCEDLFNKSRANLTEQEFVTNLNAQYMFGSAETGMRDIPNGLVEHYQDLHQLLHEEKEDLKNIRFRFRSGNVEPVLMVDRQTGHVAGAVRAVEMSNNCVYLTDFALDEKVVNLSELAVTSHFLNMTSNVLKQKKYSQIVMDVPENLQATFATLGFQTFPMSDYQLVVSTRDPGPMMRYTKDRVLYPDKYAKFFTAPEKKKTCATPVCRFFNRVNIFASPAIQASVFALATCLHYKKNGDTWYVSAIAGLLWGKICQNAGEIIQFANADEVAAQQNKKRM